MTDYQTTLKGFSTQTVDPATMWSQAHSVLVPAGEVGAFQIVYRLYPGLNEPLVQLVSVYFIPRAGTMKPQNFSASNHRDGQF